ncbi:DUF3105 domain-containing protein [Nocardioides acrostichi]|uniref:DUF3105 domain-containing protein n=1 Tax=Nocardioides acrostichi TaxID=2784339 RepID=A0A930Y6H8_9ACTN|nr:DUF3105 domain-containing protein [Nocardioides acrostichi]MBF4161002.1 DUF3105 domain-containing protein [Nocardioides acrostichi]
MSSARRRLVLVALTGLAALGVLAVGLLAPPAPRPPGPVDLDAVLVVDDLPTTHVRGPIEYPQSPPLGGRHNPVWLDCGVYDTPVQAENLVHDLEHGTVFIAYREDLSDDDVAALSEQLPSNGIMSPWADLAAPVVVTVWGHQLALDGAHDPRLPLFLRTYGGGETAPEPMASCAGGLHDADGTADTRRGGAAQTGDDVTAV